MGPYMRRVCPALVVVCFVVQPALGQQSAPAPATADVLADFEKRVTAYAALRDQLNKGAAELDETLEPVEIVAAEQALAARIRAARARASQGDLFTPAIQEAFRRLLRPLMKGVRGLNTRGAVWDEGPGPGAFRLKVNTSYPENQPLGSVPPNILEALPALPDGIEYRFVYRSLVLRDARANLIIDYMPAAIPGE